MIHPSTFKVVLTIGKTYRGRTLGYVLTTDRAYVEMMRSEPKLGIWAEAAALALDGQSVEHLALPTAQMTKSELKPRKITLRELPNGKISVRFSYSANNPEDEKIKEAFKASVESRKWVGAPHFYWQVNPTSIKQLGMFCAQYFAKENIDVDEGVKQIYKFEKERREELDSIRDEEDVELDIPGLLFDLYGYQKVGVKFAERAGGRSLNCDAPGVGKTFQGIGYGVYKNLRTLVIVPKNAKIQWGRQIRRITGHDACIWTGSKNTGNLDAQFHVMNYDIVEKNLQAILNLKFEFLICDEITKILNRNAKRTKAIIGNWKERSIYPGIKTPYVLFLSGTPVTKSHLQLFSLLRFIAPTRFGNWMRYTEKYGGPRDAPRNMDKLHDELKDIMIRRTKKQVLKDLPEKQYNPIYVEMTPSQKEQYTKLMKEVLKSWSGGLPSATEMHQVQKYLLDIKMDSIIELNDEYLEQGEAVLNFCQYREPTQRLAEHYGKDAALIDGTLSSRARQNAVDAMVDGKAKIGCFTLFAAGEAIDGLQHVSTVVNHLNMYYVPWIHEQAEDRSHRQGQTRQVQVNYFIVQDTIDEIMWELLDERHKTISLMLDGKVDEATLEKTKKKSFFKEFVRRVRENMNATDIDESKIVDDENEAVLEV